MPELRNLHSHTQFCDGRNSMEEMLIAARDAGFSTWGFSPHAPLSIPSPCNMDAGEVPSYLNEVERLRNIFPQMKLLAGMEVDFLQPDDGPAAHVVREYNLDYVIGSVHFIPNQKGVFHDIDGSPTRFAQKLKDEFNGDLDYVVRTFWKQTQSMIEAGGFNIIGHIDKIAHNASTIRPYIENEPEYMNLAEQTLRMAIERKVAIEINTKQWEKAGRFFPHPRFWRLLFDAGIELIINSDAHSVDKVDSGMGAAQKLLDSRQFL